MTKLSKYYGPQKVLFTFVLVVFSLLLHAQQPDSTADILIDTEARIDTLPEEIEAPAQVDPDYPTNHYTNSSSTYFLRKEYQVKDSLLERKLPDSIKAKLKNDDDFWYANYVFNKKKAEDEVGLEKRRKSFTDEPLFQTLLWMVIVGGFAAFIIIYLSNSNVSLFRKKNRVFDKEKKDVISDNIFDINYEKEIDKAVNNGAYRLGVRLMFLRLLKNLSDRKIIQYKHDRTNFDYLLQLHQTPYYSEFFGLTRNYEYSWYGQFDIDRDQFAAIRKDFENFDSKLKQP